MDEHRGFRPPEDHDGDEGQPDERRSIFADVPDAEPGDPLAGFEGDVDVDDGPVFSFGADTTPSSGWEPSQTSSDAWSEDAWGSASWGPDTGGRLDLSAGTGTTPADPEPTGRLPHWTEPPPAPPPTGVMPVVSDERSDDRPPGVAFTVDELPGEDAVDAWIGLEEPGTIWQDDQIEPRSTATVRIDPDTGPQATVGPPPPTDAPPIIRPAGPGRNLPLAIASGVGLVALFLGLMWLDPPGAVIPLVVAAAVVAVAELYTGMRVAGYRPAHLFGVVSTGGIVLGVFWVGAIAYPILLALAVIFSFAQVVLDPVDRPLSSVATTLLGIVWVGFGASFGALLLTYPNGKGMFLAAVVGTVAHDVCGYFVGRFFGQTPLSQLSPNKTWEGLIGGMIFTVAFVLSLALFGDGLTPWNSVGDALLLGVAIALVVPLGDLAESAIKRDLGIKDLGSILPGHGGLMDRFDGLLFALPTTYCVVVFLGLV